MDISRTLKILLVEDNSSDAKLLCRALEKSKIDRFDVVSVTRLSAALSSLTTQKFDAVILDLFLPDSRGLETLDAILEAVGRSPVIVLTGLEDEAIGVKAIQKGAEEYLLKAEVSDKSISLFISMAIERNRIRSGHQDSPAETQFHVGALEIDLIKQEVRLRTDHTFQSINLTPLEFKILALLARNQGVVLPRSRIVAEIWGEPTTQDLQISVRTLDKHVSALKRKCGSALEHLQSVYGVGYSLDPAPIKK
ncbi:MAG: hybrid sensor histidine kinase/response regulator [Bacteriovoracaceae bacterium]|nr:hybrid sensor histidine kinase/response regulator [Bacteriovoracaceae bacterium]